MIEEIEKKVKELLDKDSSGHGMDHVKRVKRLALKFADAEKANKDIVSIIALLHDVDDYKIFGEESAKNLTNARRIMSECGLDETIQERICFELHSIGYSKRKAGFSPVTSEGKVVSDADMCDALGANGILRVNAYSTKNNRPFFDRNAIPSFGISADEYVNKVADSSVCHFFEKLIHLRKLMLTDSGNKEAEKRHQAMVNFLYQLFEEEDAKEWTELLDNILNNNVFARLIFLSRKGIEINEQNVGDDMIYIDRGSFTLIIPKNGNTDQHGDFFVLSKDGHDCVSLNKESTHIYHILSGSGTFEVAGEVIEVSADEGKNEVVIPPNTPFTYFGNMMMTFTMEPNFKPENDVVIKPNKFDTPQSNPPTL